MHKNALTIPSLRAGRAEGGKGRGSLAGAERRALVLDLFSAYNLNAMAKTSTRLDLKKIAKVLDLSSEDLLIEGTLAYLLKELRLVEEDLADLRERYALLSHHELEEQIKRDSIPPHPAWEDLIQWENLEAYKQKLTRLLEQLHARV